MQFRVRPYRADDAAAIVAMSDAIYPAYRLDADAWHPAEQYDNVDVSPFKHVAVDLLTGEIAGYGAIRTTRLPYARLDLMVHPQWQRRGAGSLLLAQLCADLEALTAETAQVRVRADKPDVVAWLHKRGFAERHRMYGLRLAVPEANLEPFQPLLSRIRDQGIAITTFADARIHRSRMRAQAARLAACGAAGLAGPRPGAVPADGVGGLRPTPGRGGRTAGRVVHCESR